MAAETMKVIPPALLQAAASAAAITEQAAAPDPATALTASPGSPADAAVGTVAAGMSARSAQLSSRLAGKGPQVQTTTQAGVAALQAQDRANSDQISQLATGTPVRQGIPATSAMSCPVGPAVPAGYVVMCEPYTAGGGFVCWQWTLDGTITKGWRPTDETGGYL